jgi:hypothetical protein
LRFPQDYSSTACPGSPKGPTDPGKETQHGRRNQLTAEQIAALSPGDTVTIQSGAEFGRRRDATATVVSLLGSHIVVKCEGPRGVTFVER